MGTRQVGSASPLLVRGGNSTVDRGDTADTARHVEQRAGAALWDVQHQSCVTRSSGRSSCTPQLALPSAEVWGAR
jgi:hypothetical protein